MPPKCALDTRMSQKSMFLHINKCFYVLSDIDVLIHGESYFQIGLEYMCGCCETLWSIKLYLIKVVVLNSFKCNRNQCNLNCAHSWLLFKIN